MKYASLLLLFFGLTFSNCKTPSTASNSTPQTVRFAFYNVENLFDIYDDPKTRDEEFTPTGKKEWTEERYQKKLDQLSTVIVDLKFPEILGVCEVENEKVLLDFAANQKLVDKNYQIVHFDSPDKRGIDNGLLYQKAHFTVLEKKAIPIDFPKEVVENYTTRDILYVKGNYRGEVLHIFINHWPSRRGGLKKSEPKRVFVASQLRKKTDMILAADPKANILIMGDLNDETDNNSVVKILGAGASDLSKKHYLYNFTQPLDAAGEGSYRYKSDWNMLDQIIVSPNLTTGKLRAAKANIFQADYLNYEDKKFGTRPNKTYGGPNYYGGTSDHYPVYLELVY